jgi:cellulose synthase/poly-beta-1,6-N-acetylglucosamine synthase-like glycosyltransferase
VILLEVVFWLLLGALLWTAVGYPLLLTILAPFRTRTLARSPIEPTVSFIIAAYNEEKDIARKIKNSLAFDYPKEKLDIIVASDCSTDRTHEIVRGFEGDGVRLVILEKRGGKTEAQNAAVKVAKGEILVFTDATTEVAPESLRGLLESFADPRVGCVGAELEYVSEGKTPVGRGGSAYWQYEKTVKELEARVNSLINVSGCLYAVRASAYAPIPADLLSDFVIASDVFARGYITVYARGEVSQEKTHEDASREFEMRARIVTRSIHALFRKVEMLNAFRYGFFSLQLFSHKVLRYLVPELLIGLFATGLALGLSGFPGARLYQVLTAAQVLLYLLAGLGWLCLRFKVKIPLIHIPFYFVHANAASLLGLVLYLRGERKVTWTTVR